MSTRIEIGTLPESVDAYTALRDRIGQTAEGGAALFVAALNVWAENRDLGWPLLTMATDRSRLQKGPGGVKGWELLLAERRALESRVGAKPYIARSYLVGTAASAGYRLPPAPLAVEVSDNPHSGDRAAGSYKVFVACSGAASPRPVKLKRNNRGIWKAVEWSSLTLGIVAPAVEEDDDL